MSLTTARIEVRSEGGLLLEVATGFFYRPQPTGRQFLITNWHVVTGRLPSEPQMSRHGGAVPCLLHVLLHRKHEKGVSPTLIHSAVLEINNSDGEAPAWIEHPQLGHRADVVAMPINDGSLDDCWITSIGDEGMSATGGGLEPRVIDDVYVLGYPWGLSGAGRAMPLYKRGSVASEPDIPQANLPRFLIDCRTAAGMSGGPVLAAQLITGPEGLLRRRVGFVGVYSGRLTEGDIQRFTREPGDVPPASSGVMTEIGIVWRRQVVEEIVADNVTGTKLSEMLRN